MNVGKCSQPWFEMQIQYDTQVRPCCYYAENMYAWDFSCPVDVRELWNSQPLMVVRAVIASDMNEDSPCSACQFVRYASVPSFLEIDDAVNELQRCNWEAAIRNYEARSLVVDSTPVKFYFNFGLACNLSCLMCCQMDQRGHDSRVIPAERLLEFKEYLVRANEIVVIGGEPLVLHQALAFIEAMANDPDYSNVKLTILTNATLLDRFMPLLRNMRRLNLMVSLDSVDDSYEKIRRRASWAQTSKNVLAFKQESLEHNGLWSISVSSIIMKTSIPKLADFARWCIINDIPVFFGPLVEYPFTESENVFKHPELLDELPGWEKQFDEAIALLEQKGWEEKGSGPLRLMKEQLTAGWKKKYEPLRAVQGDDTGVDEHCFLTSHEPLVSIVLCVKNGMPYLPDAIESLMGQTYRNFELIVQDGASTDGSLEYLRQIKGLPCMEIESAPDGRAGEAYARAFNRCRGEIVGSMTADDLLEKDALAIVVQRFIEHPDCAAIYGSSSVIAEDGFVLNSWVAPDFDPLGLIECDIVPPLAVSFFSRKQCGVEWRIDENLNFCFDYDLWLRISDKPILHIDRVLGRTRIKDNRVDGAAEQYELLCKDKIFAIDMYLNKLPAGSAKEWLRRKAYAGIYAWAAETLLEAEGSSSMANKFVALSKQYDHASVRLLRLSDKILRYS